MEKGGSWVPPRRKIERKNSKKQNTEEIGSPPLGTASEPKEEIIIDDKEKYHRFLDVIKDAIEENNYVRAYKILNEARDYVTANALAQKSFLKLEAEFNRNLKQKLESLGFVDVSGKILSTTFWAMNSSGNLALKGPPGVGKSFFSKGILPNLWVEKGYKPQVLVIQPDRNMDIASLVADRGIRKGDTIVEEGQIADAVNLTNKGRNTILVLEEINQWPPKVLKDLNDFLEERKLERKIAGKSINLRCSKEKLFIIANYNPEGYTLGEDDTGSVSSRFIFCDLPFPSKDDLQKIVEVNTEDRDYTPTSIGDEVKRSPTKPFLRSMSDICYSLRSAIEAGELGPLAMPIGTRTIINFSRALINNNIIGDAITKSLVDPVLEKYVREGPLTNVESQVYEEYIRTVFKVVKQVLGTINPVNEKDLKSLQKGLNLTISELFRFQGKKPYEINVRKASKSIEREVRAEPLAAIEAEREAEPIPIVEEKKELPVREEVKVAEVIHEPVVQQSRVIQEDSKKAEIIVTKPVQASAKQKKIIPELKCLICGSNMSLAKDTRGKRNLICNNTNCRNILPVPQYGELKVFPKTCKICSGLILQITRRNGKILHICPVCWRTPEVNGPCETCRKFAQCVK